MGYQRPGTERTGAGCPEPGAPVQAAQTARRPSDRSIHGTVVWRWENAGGADRIATFTP